MSLVPMDIKPPELSSGEVLLLRDAPSDDVTFDWVLIHLGLLDDLPQKTD
jgi:hypothetical protein